MLTSRNVFSNVFTNSAVRQVLTGTTRSTSRAMNAAATSVQRGVSPPTTRGMRVAGRDWLPGSMRSGA
nr:hypothetical protein GCM10020241_11730 [Streptoalloteichus tenebrarius]